LAEQHRIVAKVDEMMAICDSLEAQLTAMQDQKGSLLEGVLYSALADNLESDSRANLRTHELGFLISSLPAYQ
jgi:type I restriction enzyme S subunit